MWLRDPLTRLYGDVMKLLIFAAAVLVIVVAPIAAQQAPQTPAEQALFESAFLGKLADVERFVGEGATVDALDPESRTAMMFAAFNGHRHVVGYLLTQGAKVDSKDSNGRTALMYASSGPYAETVEEMWTATRP